MRSISLLTDGLNKFVAAAGKIAAWALVLLIGVIIFDVISRRFFVVPSTKLQELEWHLHAFVFLLALGYTYVHDGHVRIDTVRDLLSERAKNWIEILGLLVFFFPFIGMVFYFSIEFVHVSFVTLEGSSAAVGLPYRWIIKSTVPIGMGLLLLSGIASLLGCIEQLFCGDAKKTDGDQP